MGIDGFSYIHGCARMSWISMDVHGSPWISMDILGHPWILQDIQRFPWIYRDINGCQCISMECHVHGSRLKRSMYYPWITGNHFRYQKARHWTWEHFDKTNFHDSGRHSATSKIYRFPFFMLWLFWMSYWGDRGSANWVLRPRSYQSDAIYRVPPLPRQAVAPSKLPKFTDPLAVQMGLRAHHRSYHSAPPLPRWAVVK